MTRFLGQNASFVQIKSDKAGIIFLEKHPAGVIPDGKTLFGVPV